MHLHRRAMLGGAAALAAATLGRPSLGQGTGGGAGGRGSVVRFIPSTPLPSLDPISATSYVIRNHGYLVYDTLFATDEHFNIRPQMVESWDTAPDRLRWTFHLRDGLLFHDETPVRAADCIASIKRWSARDAFGQTLAGFVEGYEAVDARTFAIRLKRPFPLLPDALGKISSNVPFIMPERIASTDPMRNIAEAIGSGPWRMLQSGWVPGQTASYERFAKYRPREEAPSWAAGGKVAKIDRIEWLALTEPAAAVGAITQGEVDWYEQPPVDLLPVLRRDRNIEVVNVPLGLSLIMRFNQTQAPFNNPKVRQALAMAANQADYMQSVVGSPDYYAESKSFFTRGTPMSTGAGGAEAMRADLARARAMLKEAGYGNERVVLLAPADQPIAYNQSLVSQDLLKQLGMNVDLVATDWASFIGRRANRGPVEAGGWSMFHTLWSGADTLNPAMHTLLRANGSAAWFGWPEDTTLEGLRDQWLAATDDAARKTLAGQIEQRAFQSLPYVPMGQVQQPMAYRKSLRGMVLAPAQFFWNMEKQG
ncbi:ABC transporter substrate-binding protein [Roseomonas sp. NAR14]|uniref:ABC transporter substrate-binding protein n=1 Tax=Roseomonas acroporae TaxID=2937791 RepID=A0A9X2BV88_9PROT|nr:ABC transporter substrate-binding protein [Roseomonas acroporae]MCK8784826.1 ABC transporter substrate-binding protein [Roseomonas acroporae]